MRKTWFPWPILSPSLLFLLLFTWFPLGRSVYDSLFDTRIVSDGGQYVGLENFSRLFAACSPLLSRYYCAACRCCG
jgi:sn-glycerol 3-phosphate transport system permease protein